MGCGGTQGRPRAEPGAEPEPGPSRGLGGVGLLGGEGVLGHEAHPAIPVRPGVVVAHALQHHEAGAGDESAVRRPPLMSMRVSRSPCMTSAGTRTSRSLGSGVTSRWPGTGGSWPAMHLVGCHGFVETISLMPLGHPFVVAPGIFRVPNDRRGFRRCLVEARKRIGFIDPISEQTGNDMIFVERAPRDIRKKAFPDSRLPAGAQFVTAFLPIIKVADEENPLRVGSPNGKIDPVGAGVIDEMSAELVVEDENDCPR